MAPHRQAGNMTCTRPQAKRQILLATRASSKQVSQVLMSDTFLGLEVVSHRNLALWLVETNVAPAVLNEIAAVGRFEKDRGAGIACQIDVEDAVGLLRQMKAIEAEKNRSGA